MPKPLPKTPVEQMLEQTRRPVKRLRAQIADLRATLNFEGERIEKKIKVASALIEALEKGTLKL